MKYFTTLNYSLGDEDSSVEVRALPERSRHVVCIAGSGARVVSLLAKKPAKITCVDILPEQLALTELRVEAIRRLEYEEFLQLMGYAHAGSTPRRREELFGTLRLRQASHRVLRDMFSRNDWEPIIYVGKFEQMLVTLSRFFRLVVGDKIKKMFECDTPYEQRRYFDSVAFPRWRWNAALFLFGNAAVLNALLYKGDFPRKNIPGSAYRNYQRIFASLFSNVSCRESFFLQMLLLGELRFLAGALFEVERGFFDDAKRSLDGTEIVYAQEDVVDVMKAGAAAVDFLSLSDVPSFFGADRERSFMGDIRDGLAGGGRVAFRGHLRMAHPDTRGYADITDRYADAIKAEKTQLWNVRIFEKR